MAGQVFAVASGKGGVGKTTTVVNLGVVLRRADHSVALVDADLGMANLGTVLGVDGGLTIHDVLAGRATVAESLAEEADGFAVLPGSQRLTDYPEADPEGLGDVLETLVDDYDYVLVDTGAGMSHEDVLPLGLAAKVVLVASPDPAAVGDTRKTAELVELAGGTVAGLVVTQAVGSTDATHVASQVGVDLLGVVPFDSTVRESTASGRPLEAVAPESPAATAYRDLAGRLSERAGAPAATSSGDASPDDGASDAASATPSPEPSEPSDEATAETPEPDAVSTSEASTTEPSGGAGASDGPDPAEAPAGPAEGAVESTDADLGPDADGADEPDREPADDGDRAATEPDDEEVDPVSTAEPEAAAAESAADGQSGEPAPESDAEADDDPSEAAEEPPAAQEVQTGPTAGEPTESDDEEEEDYLAEFEDDDPPSGGGVLSRLGRLFR